MPTGQVNSCKDSQLLQFSSQGIVSADITDRLNTIILVLVELMEADEEAFASLAMEKRIKQLKKLCKEKQETSPFKIVYRNMKFDGKLLP